MIITSAYKNKAAGHAVFFKRQANKYVDRDINEIWNKYVNN